MTSFAYFVVVSMLAATALGNALQPAEILTDGAKFEETVKRACIAEVAVGTMVGPEGDVAAGGACACQQIVGGVVFSAVLLAGVAKEFYGCPPWDFATPSSDASKPHKQQMVARRSVLDLMKDDLKELDDEFAKMGTFLSKMTQSINEKSWGDVAAWADMALATAGKFTQYMFSALKQDGCLQPPPKVTCPDSYELLNDGHTKTCQDQPEDCYDACCREQDKWCHGDTQCQHDRGCGPTLTPAPSFDYVNCKDLMKAQTDFGEAVHSLRALRDCAEKLKIGVKSENGCSATVEQQVRAQIGIDFKQVREDLGRLAELYKKTTPALAMALVDKRSNVPSNLAVLANAPWQQSYAQVSSSCASMKRKADVWLDCKGSTAGGKMQVGEMLISLFLIVLLLVVGCYVYFRFIDSARRGRATEKEGPLLEVAGGRALRLVEKARPKVFVTFLVVYTLLIGLVALLTPSPINALCQQNFQRAQNMFDVCDDFASALKAGSDSGNNGLEELLSKTVTGMATIDKVTMPK